MLIIQITHLRFFFRHRDSEIKQKEFGCDELNFVKPFLGS